MAATPQTMPDIVYSRVLEGIIDGSIDPGTQLIDRKLAAELDVSRTPVREALSKLAKDGIIDSFPRWGYYTKEFKKEDITMIFDIREGLEIISARLAAEKCKQSDIYSLEKNAALYAEIDYHDRKLHALNDRLFHNAIAEISGNHYLQTTIENYHVLSIISLSSNAVAKKVPDVTEEYFQVRHERAITEHQEIINAIRSKDPVAAEQTMRKHIIDARAGWLNVIEGEAE